MDHELHATSEKQRESRRFREPGLIGGSCQNRGR